MNNTPAGLDPNGLENNGGPTPTIALLPSNPAINAIPLSPTNYCTAIDGVTAIATDQRGVTRPQGPACDIGAFERVPDALLLSYAANLHKGGSFVNLTNAGSVAGTDPAGDICANVYVFAADQQLIACCSCPLTPNHLRTLSVSSDLATNVVPPNLPNDVTVALVASTSCDPAAVTAVSLAEGLSAWRTTLHALAGGSYAVTENAFAIASLSASELAKLTSICGFIQSNGSGSGICNTCANGAQGANRK